MQADRTTKTSRRNGCRTGRRTGGAILAMAALTASAGVAGHALADELFVPSDDYPTLQAALDAAADGDVVVIGAGTLTGPGNWNLTMPGRRLTFRGETGNPADVVWQGSGDPYIEITRGMTVESSGASGTRFEGLTIRHFTSQGGGAFRVGAVELAFDNCVFERNSGAAMECFTGESGGAIRASGSTIRFTDCVIRNHSVGSVVCSSHGASTSGGAIAGGAELVFERCLLEGNRSAGSEYDGASGGAIASAGVVTFIDSVVRNNDAFGSPATGGAVSAGRVIAINSTFTGNQARGFATASGGAIAAGSVTIIGGAFLDNTAGRPGDTTAAAGGALRITGEADITNATFADNLAWGWGDSGPVVGGAMSIGGGTLTGLTMAGNQVGTLFDDFAQAVHARAGGDVQMANTVVDNGDQWLRLDDGATFAATWSCIVGGFPGEGNIDADPMLGVDFRPLPGSPVIDAGNTTLLPADAYDLDGDGDTTEPIPFDAAGLARAVDDPATPDTGVGSPVVDMGAYEVQSDCRADFDGDGVLTIFDFLAFQNAFDAGDLAADFDGDGELTLFDFLAFQNEFDAGCA